MKKASLTILLTVLLLQGCQVSSRVLDPLPNTGRGFWQDVRGTVEAMADYHSLHIYQNEKRDVPRAMYQLEERIDWLGRMKAVLKRQQGTPIQ